ncbi:MAG TPA: HAMP domain-containing sensor histidine kinase [Bryobacteraceae bacterium]|nr:HAMP domain-containing sensor histidine kinase [Bryobacteraceae bacterium]
MNRIRNRLIAVFLAATLAPLAATWWIATELLERSVAFSSTDQLDRLSRTLEQTGRTVYQQAREQLRRDAGEGRIQPTRYTGEPASWPSEIREFADAAGFERFRLSDDGKMIDLLVRRGDQVLVYSRAMEADLPTLSAQIRGARETVAQARGRDLRSGLIRTFALLVGAVWCVSLALLIFLAHRLSRPVQQLTAGLARLAAGDLATRIPAAGNDEAGRAIRAFNETAAQLEQSRERLVYLTQIASWRTLARKMAHEIKNSLTPIRLTMEEILARGAADDPRFVEQAARITVDEVETLERRVRAFSEFSSEPSVRSTTVDVNAAVEERIALLEPGRSGVRYEKQFARPTPLARADADLVKGVLTNLLENAADAAREVLVITATTAGRVSIEVHDSGPGLSEQARQTLFEPTITFKKRGMGLGLSIARNNALLCGGDLELIESRLGGAAFRLSLPATAAPALVPTRAAS